MCNQSCFIDIFLFCLLVCKCCTLLGGSGLGPFILLELEPTVYLEKKILREKKKVSHDIAKLGILAGYSYEDMVKVK